MITDVFKKFLWVKPPKQKARKDFFSIKLRETDIAIDCGANVGSITQHLCKSGATVFAFEPNPYAFQVLQDKFSNMKNVHCIQKGVSDKKDKVNLYLHENSDKDEIHWSTGSSLLDFKGNIRKDKYIEVEIIDLCEFIESLNRNVKVLKMDVEGVECKILKKIINTGVIEKIGYAFVETHDHKIPELKHETDMIRELIKVKGLKNISLDWR